MKKRRERIGLSVILVLALVSVSNATLSMDLSGSSMDIGGAAIVITISSDTAEAITWGVYLDPTSEYPTDALLQNAAILGTAGTDGAVTAGGNPDAGHDYISGPTSGSGKVQVGDWSTVEFVGLTVGSYDVILTDGGSTGSELARASINVVPEPATIALLGLGGMFLLRRRR